MTPAYALLRRGRPLKIAAAGVAMFTLLMVFAVQRIPAPAEAAEQQQFDEAWIDTMRPLALKNADLERTVFTLSTELKSVVTERVIPSAPDGAPASMPPVVLLQDDDKPPASRHRRHPATAVNVCTRHGMHKVAVRGGSWRCRR